MNYICNMEIWKDIPGYEGIYQVSNLGNVKSLNYKKMGIERLMMPQIDVTGYYHVKLSVFKGHKKYKIHQLVAMAFLNHKPSGFNFVVDHINSNKLDNNVSNLRIVTFRENISKEYRDKTGLPTGVSYFKKSNKYRANILLNKKQKHLGLFSTPEEASEAYQKALKTNK